MPDDHDEPVPAACRAILTEWKAAPTTDFGPEYQLVTWLLEDIAAARKSGRLDDLTAGTMVDGTVVRVRRGDAVPDIMAWVEKYAARRGYTWRAPR